MKKLLTFAYQHNRTMRILIPILAFTLLFSISCSSASSTTETETKKADINPAEMLKAAYDKFYSLDNFSCKVRVGSPLDSTSTPFLGEYYFSKNKYHIDLEDEITCNGDSILTWYKEFGQVQLSVFNPLTDLTLGGVYHLYNSHHELSYAGKDKNLEKFELKATTSDDLFPKKVIWVDPATMLITRYAFYSNQSGNYLYELTDIKTNTALDPKMFELDRELIRQSEAGTLKPIGHGEGDGHDHKEDDGHKHKEGDGHKH